MIRVVQFSPKPDMGIWLQKKVDEGFRSAASIVQEIVAEKMKEELKEVKNVVEQNEVGGAQ